MLLALLLACPPANDPAGVDTASKGGDTAIIPSPGCGDGVLQADEACDAGEANSDSVADACRTDCLPARCGDGVTDAGEACDDANLTGGDGCAALCTAEVGTLEAEPNDDASTATPASFDASAFGALPAEDVDCFSVEVAACGAIRASQLEPCGPALALSLRDADGNVYASGAPNEAGCATLEPAEAPGARFMEAGTWSVCVEAANEAPVAGYALSFESVDPTTLGVPATEADTDLDTIPDSCDADIDGDGVDNESDNCPEVSNGPDTPALELTADGFVVSWLVIGAYTTGVTTGECRPSEEAFVGEDVGTRPEWGATAGDFTWQLELNAPESYDYLTRYGSFTPSREAYSAVFLHSPEARTLTLAVGADDGVFAWWNGEQVLDVASCQGVYADNFTVEVPVLAGENTLLLKVRDWGGGWGVQARMLDGGFAVTTLTPALSSDPSWRPDQTDSDGDGLGDVCDE